MSGMKKDMNWVWYLLATVIALALVIWYAGKSMATLDAGLSGAVLWSYPIL